MNHADDLERIIRHLDKLFYLGQPCIHPDTNVIVSDGEYDGFRRELKTLRPDSKVFDTASAADAFDPLAGKVAHDPPMTSIEKASSEDQADKESQLFKWMIGCIEDCRIAAKDLTIDLDEKDFAVYDAKTFKPTKATKRHTKREYQGQVVKYPRNFFFASRKLDGTSVALYYVNGKLVKAGLRPRDGVNGEDVTEQVKYVSGIKVQLDEPVTCSIRGEIICKNSDFLIVQAELAAAGEKPIANPRAASVGIRQFKDPTIVKTRRLSFMAHGIEDFHGKLPYSTEIEKAKYCSQKLGIPFVRTEPFNFYLLEVFEENAKHLDYWTDGVVIGVDSLELQEQMGRHGNRNTGNPKAKIAWKFAEEHAPAPIETIDWQVGRTGVIKPVSNFKPVPLDGTQVRRATLHNLGFMLRNKIGVGTVIDILKAGAIIPKCVGVISGQVATVDYPKVCPSCGETTIVRHTPAKGTPGKKGYVEEKHELFCQNDDCPAKHIEQLCHFLSTLGVLGIGESNVEDLVDVGVVKRFSDFYKLSPADCAKAGCSKRQTHLLLGRMQMIPKADQMDDDALGKLIAKCRKEKKRIPMWQFFAALGIKTAGKACGKALAAHFNSFDDVRAASVEELEAVPEVGKKTAVIVAKFLAVNSREIDELLKFIELELPKKGKLTGKKFVFSGSFDLGKKHWEKAVEAVGGTCSGNVSKSCDYLVAGPGSGDKSDLAKQYGVPIIDVDELKKML